jgi:hypothetical protein
MRTLKPSSHCKWLTTLPPVGQMQLHRLDEYDIVENAIILNLLGAIIAQFVSFLFSSAVPS